ncbi:MAG: hypothetical protein HY647_12980 [Acidobacteria bacterium]|nr:hypothetical protein [Acidobacteriota bacterium]
MSLTKQSWPVLGMALWLALAGARSAWGQATCTSNIVPTLVRSQGLTENISTITLSNCSGVIPGSGASLSVTILPSSVPITNSPDAGFLPTVVVTTTAGIGPALPGSVSDSTVTFALPATPVGATLTSIQIGTVPAVPGTVGIRVNANAVGAQSGGQITALVTVSPSGTLAITNSLLPVAISRPGLSATITPGFGIFQGSPPDLIGVPPTASFAPGPTPIFMATDTQTGFSVAASSVPILTVREGFGTSFLVAGAPAAGNGEGADTSGIGTRLLIRLTLPSNVVVYAPESLGPVFGGTLSLTLVSGANSSGAGGVPIAVPSPVTADRIIGTTLTYEVTTSSNAAEEEIGIPLGFFTTGVPSPAGPIPVSVELAPVSNVDTASSIGFAPIPRFVPFPLPLLPPQILLNPAGLGFRAALGTNPPLQTITIANAGGSTLNWTAFVSTSSGGNWLSLSANSGTAPTTVAVLINSANLAAGTYQGTLQISSPEALNSPQIANVELIVGTPAISLSPNSLLFVTSAGSNPASQTFQVNNAGTGFLNWSASVITQSGGNWLSISPTAGVSPSTITATVDSATLPAGSYTATIIIVSAPSGIPAGNSPQVANVTLSVEAPAISPGGIVNGASFSANGIISPRSLVSLFGTKLARDTAKATAVPLPTTLAGTKVFVNNIPAPLFSVSPGQINFQAPVELSGVTAEVVVEADGVRGQKATVSVEPESPGIFTVPSGGTGQGAVLNQDSSLNAPQNPARADSIIQIFATGLGAADPSVASGQAAGTSPLSLTLAKPEVLIGGTSAVVLFSGLAPELVGVYQVNARVPATTAAGDVVLLQIRIGTRVSNVVTIAVR